MNLEQQQVKQPHSLSYEHQQWLVECLQHSPIRIVRIAPELGEASLNFWADACEQADKLVFLRVPCSHELPSSLYPLSWWLKRLIEGSIAALLLLTLSPVMLVLILGMRLQSPKSIFCKQWCIGERGRLFRRLELTPIEEPHPTQLRRWMHKYSLDKLLQLFNVLRGEMSLVGPSPWALNNVMQISPEERQHLNALPGIIGAKRIAAGKPNLLDSDTINRSNLEYLRSWSLWQDLKILLMSILKVFSGFGYQ